MATWWQRLRRHDEKHRGQALLEMALLTPFFALILIGALDLGRMMIYQNRLNSAVKEAAMLGLYQTDPSTIAGRAYLEVTDPATGRQLLGSPGVDFVIDRVECFNGTTAATKVCTNPAPGDYLEVEAHYIFQPITTQLLVFLPADLSLRKTVRVVY